MSNSGMPTISRTMPARERLLVRLDAQPNGCWYWTGVIDYQNYGRVGYQGRRSVPVQQAVYGHVAHACGSPRQRSRGEGHHDEFV